LETPKASSARPKVGGVYALRLVSDADDVRADLTVYARVAVDILLRRAQTLSANLPGLLPGPCPTRSRGSSMRPTPPLAATQPLHHPRD